MESEPIRIRRQTATDRQAARHLQAVGRDHAVLSTDPAASPTGGVLTRVTRGPRLPSSMPAHIPASLQAVRTEVGDSGTRLLIARVSTDEPVSVRSRLTRGKRMIGGGRAELSSGTHEVRLAVSADARGGDTKLTLVLTDQAGHRRTLTRPVTVPAPS